MGKNWPWDCRLTVLKTIEMMLVRPSRTNFKMTVTANYCFYYCILLPSPYKSSCLLMVRVKRRNWPLDKLLSHPHQPPYPHPTLSPPPSGCQASKIKTNFPSQQPELFIGFWAVSRLTPLLLQKEVSSKVNQEGDRRLRLKFFSWSRVLGEN